MIIVTAVIRKLLFDAGLGIAKFLGGALIGIVLMMGASTLVIGGTSALTMFGFVSTGIGTRNTNAGGNPFVIGIPPIQLGGGFVSDIDRYILATTAGWKGDDALIAVAISIAEDGKGDPAITNRNTDGSIDVGLWQINSGPPPAFAAWQRFGGEEPLKDPAVNAWAAHTMWSERGFEPWTTFRFNTYLQYMARARAAANGVAANSGSDVFPLPGWTGQINLHWGIAPGGSDLFAPQGQPIVSVSAGKVLEAGFDRIGGNAVLIAGDDGLQYYYAHFVDTPAVHVGQHILPGILLGHVGNTGDADRGPTHLHIGIGHTILLGADAFGGTGSGFDAVTFLRQLYAQMHAGG